MADGQGRSLATLITPGQAADTRQLVPLLDKLSVPRSGRGRPRKRPDSVTADKAYSSRANRTALRGRGIRANIPEPADQIANRRRRGSRGGRPTSFDAQAYKHRNQVERGFCRRKQWRGIATRFDKLAVHYQAALDLVETLDWLRHLPQDRDKALLGEGDGHVGRVGEAVVDGAVVGHRGQRGKPLGRKILGWSHDDADGGDPGRPVGGKVEFGVYP
jgi:transposase